MVLYALLLKYFEEVFSNRAKEGLVNTSSVLTDIRVREIFADCFESDPGDTIKRVSVEGIRPIRFTFHPRPVEGHRDEIRAMLAELPDPFKESKGGGACFVSSGCTRQGEKWTNSYDDQEKLTLLGVATGLVEYCMPHERPEAGDRGRYFVVKL